MCMMTVDNPSKKEPSFNNLGGARHKIANLKDKIFEFEIASGRVWLGRGLGLSERLAQYFSRQS